MRRRAASAASAAPSRAPAPSSLLTVALACARRYVKAHDAYIKCAIGNAPWPMGITGTGIHERQGRQHLREDKVAHVMNDETQRKYLQSVKRLMTYAQKALPPDGPSKMVLNGSMI